jgi:hypothetical protein
MAIGMEQRSTGRARTGDTRARLAVAACAGLLLTAGVHADQRFTARDGGPTEAEMLARGDQGLARFAFVRPVLAGVLYRAGFKGGDQGRSGLSEAQRVALCEAGFSGATYVDFGTKTHYGATTCGSHRFEYGKGSSSSVRAIMRDIHRVIENPEKGPILVHCMWGVHASGAVAAMALVQFCDWPEARAKAYWEKARNGAPCAGGCDRWIDSKFATFEVDPSLRISAQQKEHVCPK